MPPKTFLELRERLAEIHDIGRARAVLAWDERTMMPPGGAAARAEQMATLSGVLHAKLTSDEIARLLDEADAYVQHLPYDSDEASKVRITRREHERAKKVPGDLKIEMARAGSLGEHAWIEARERSDFSLFLPHLQKNVELNLRYAECLASGAEHPYDPLLDDYEPGMTLAEAKRLLDTLKEGIVPLVARATERDSAVDDSYLYGDFPAEKQRELLLAIVGELPLDNDCIRIDESPHPFQTSFATRDVRITTRYSERYLASSLFCTLHEFGHALYDNGVDPALERGALGRPASLGVHESQSRLWENMIGRSRPFWQHFYGKVQRAFPGHFGEIPVGAFHRAVNKVQNSLIRTEADEVTYNLHVILRFELEREILEGSIDLRDLPEIWNARTNEYLGLDVPDDARGVLQDVHWADGSFGYFPTYSFGNIISGQLWAAMREDLPDLDDQIAKGELWPVREWLREKVHCHGRKFRSTEIVERAVGGPIDAEPYLEYLRAKIGALYGD